MFVYLVVFVIKLVNNYTSNFKFWIVLCVWCWFVVVFCGNVFIKQSNTCWLSFSCCFCGLLFLLEIFFSIICVLNLVNIIPFLNVKIIYFLSLSKYFTCFFLDLSLEFNCYSFNCNCHCYYYLLLMGYHYNYQYYLLKLS